MKKMLLVLECFSASEPHLAPSAIARRAGLPRATAHRIIQTLRHIGFLEQDRERDHYRLGLKLFELAGFAVGQADLARVAAQPAATLARVTGETVHLSVFDGLRAVVVNRLLPDATLSDVAPGEQGDLAPAHCTASGKAMLAFQPASRVARVLEAGLTRMTAATLTDEARLRAELEIVREAGYALDHGEWQAGLCCVAAPVRDRAGQVFAALSLCGPAARMPPARLAALKDLVVDRAAAISAGLADVSAPLPEGRMPHAPLARPQRRSEASR